MKFTEKEISELGFKKLSAETLDKLSFNPFEMIGKRWFLVTAGNESGYNTMTASWGFAGVMWGKNTFTTVIRPQRYTKNFIDKSDYFTISFFDDEYKKALSFCGSHSGRDFDKAKETGLSPLHFSDSSQAYGNEYSFDVTAFEQASTIFVCKKAYVQPMTEEATFDSKDCEKWFGAKDFHVQYIGEIAAVYTK